jgi:hypothetical protein
VTLYNECTRALTLENLRQLVGPHNTVCDIGTTIQDLEAHQQNMFYEVCTF